MVLSNINTGPLRTLFRTIIEQAPLAVAVVDADLRLLLANEAMAAVTGLPTDRHRGRLLSEVLPGLDGAAAMLAQTVFRSGQPIVDRPVEGMAPATPGAVRSWSASVYPIDLADGADLGVTLILNETTGQRRAERRLRRLLDGLFSFVGLLDPDGIVLEANRTALEAIGVERAGVLGQPFWETPWWEQTPTVTTELRAAIARARSGEVVRYDTEVCLAGDVRVAMDFQLVPLTEDGVVTGLVASGIDITERRTEGDRLLAFAELARALAVAVHTRDVASALQVHLSAAFGAAFANLALVDHRSQNVLVAHQPDLDTSIADRYTSIPLAASTPLTEAIRTGRIVTLANLAETAGRYPELLADTEAAGLMSTASIPLHLDGSITGAIGIGWHHPLHLDDSLLAGLTAVGELTAETLARTRTADTQTAFIAELQASMLPAPWTGTGLDIAAVYQPAGTGLGFGGDWYDIIEIDEHRTAVVVGDVVGHGIEAAASMVLVRSAIKAVVHLGTPVEDIFSVAGKVINGPQDTYIGTAVVLVIDTRHQHVQYSSAGHPPVVVVHPDGSSAVLDGHSGIVLGVHDRSPAADTAPFPPGSIAVAYTDGLVETRTGTIDAGIERVRAATAVGRLDGSDARSLGDRLIATIPDLAELDDDVALVVIRS
ncbi:hypothetical protein BH10ACT1_BH10ACT1_03910 [soil metagenome]